MGLDERKVIGGGAIGGKAEGFLRARDLLLSEEMRREHPDVVPLLRFPVSFFIGSDVFDEFIDENRLKPVLERCKHCCDEVEFAHLKQLFLDATLPLSLLRELGLLLKEIRYPLAVRSSSMLEDRSGTSFAGKYETVFISNRGTLPERIQQLAEAIKNVYASTFNPNALEYRRRHGLLEDREHMAILLQEAVGRPYGKYFLPLMAGVGFSKSDYCWNPEVKKEDGLVRLVFGLGTRAVGRGYARLFSPGKPLVRPEGNDVREIDKFSQATIDALNLEENRIDSFHFSRVVHSGIDCYPRAEGLFSLRDGNHLYVPPTRLWTPEHRPVLTFDKVLQKPWCRLPLPQVVSAVFKRLEEEMGYAVDVEFAVRVDDIHDEAHFYLVQARPLSQRDKLRARRIPKNIPKKDKLFYMNKNVPSGRVRNIEYIVYVDPQRYHDWPHPERPEVARIIGKINRLLAGKVFILMGPGRWGSAKIELGVPTKYSEISNCAMLVEIARMRAGYVPEVSFGTHFFQDLIEDGIVYVPMYPDDEGTVFNERFLHRESSFPEMLTEPYYRNYDELVRVIHIPKVAGGRLATAALNGEEDEGLIYLKK
jgi:hypothetical protein